MGGKATGGQEAWLSSQWARRLKAALARTHMLCEHPNQKITSLHALLSNHLSGLFISSVALRSEYLGSPHDSLHLSSWDKWPPWGTSQDWASNPTKFNWILIQTLQIYRCARSQWRKTSNTEVFASPLLWIIQTCLEIMEVCLTLLRFFHNGHVSIFIRHGLG